jgi:hypothetical protein
MTRSRIYPHFFAIHPGNEQFLLVIAEKTDLGHMPGVGHVNRIDRVVSIPLSSTPTSSEPSEILDIPDTLLPCPKHKKNAESEFLYGSIHPCRFF